MDPQEDILQAAIQGNASALERLLAENYRRLAAHLKPRLPADLQESITVEDVLQEAFVEVFQRIDRFEPRGEDPFYKWVAKIADHKLVDLARAARTAKRGGGRRAVDPERSQVIGLLEQYAVSTRTPSRSVAVHEAAAAVHAGLAQLPDDYREALRLRYIEGLTVAEAA